MGEPLDDITAFLGSIPADEYEQRRRIRTCRNAASYKASQTSSSDARALAWMVAEFASVWVYRPAPLEALGPVVELLRSLLACADQVEVVEALP